MIDKRCLSIYAAGMLQGTALVAFPAASTILTSPEAYNFTSTQYGSLFISQSLLSILTALINPLFCKRLGAKRTLGLGLIANFLSMALLALSAIAMKQHTLAYGMLFIATGCLGMGFGMVVPTINRMAEEIYPEKSDASVLTLNALLGVGTTISPVLIALFSSIGFWWGLPFTLASLLLALFLLNFQVALPEEAPSEAEPKENGRNFPLVSIFVAFAFLYGIIETLNGNWISIYMRTHLDASINVQSLALTSFWGMVTFGRVFFAITSKVLSSRRAFQIAPFISAIAFAVIATLVTGQEYWAVVAFGLTGFGCSVLLPLLISFGGKELKRYAASVPGMIISCYLLGYGVTAFGVGPLSDIGHISLKTLYAIGSLIALVLGILSLCIVRGKTLSTSK